MIKYSGFINYLFYLGVQTKGQRSKRSAGMRKFFLKHFEFIVLSINIILIERCTRKIDGEKFVDWTRKHHLHNNCKKNCHGVGIF